VLQQLHKDLSQICVVVCHEDRATRVECHHAQIKGKGRACEPMAHALLRKS
jgi:hypothetical protein